MAPVIHCCCCLNLSGNAVPAETIVNGYAVCDEHVDLASHPKFDIFALKKEKRSL